MAKRGRPKKYQPVDRTALNYTTQPRHHGQVMLYNGKKKRFSFEDSKTQPYDTIIAVDVIAEQIKLEPEDILYVISYSVVVSNTALDTLELDDTHSDG